MNPLGDLALRFSVPAPAAARRALETALREAPGVVDAVLAEHEGLVAFAEPADRARVEEEVTRARARAAELHVPPALHRVRVIYDGEDLGEVARQTGLAPDRVVSLHASARYEVTMLGFLPGFAYLRGLPEELVLPRRASPRARVPAGALAMAAEYTGFYPFASPGGWHLLGRALDLDAFTAERGARFALGDRVELEPTEAPRADAEIVTPATRANREEADGALEVRKALGPSLVVDLGRPGHMHAGVPPGGPLVPEAFVLANRALGNPAGASGLEIHGTLELVARGDLRIADGRGEVHALRAGETLTLSPGRAARVTYAAIEGGLAVPRVLGGAGTLLVAGLGGHEGRPLRRGDVLGACGAGRGDAPRWCVPASVAARAADEVVLLPGPDADAATLEALARGRFRTTLASDRTGTRIEGELPPLPGAARRPSTPMVQGVVERTPEGLIVLGPDHPTTGGYPVVAVVAAASRGALFARPLGAEIRFRLAGP